MDALLTTQIIGGPVPWVLCVLSASLVFALVLRRPHARWMILAGAGILAGAVIALGLVIVADVTAMFEIPLPIDVAAWSIATFAAVGLGAVSLWKTTWWRRSLAIVGIGVFAVTGVVQVNAAFGLNPTVGDLLGVVVRHPIALPKNHGTPASTDGPALTAGWVAPHGMPAIGKTGTVVIPATVSGFHARPAGLYLPPAALVKNAPALPLVIMMMGYPGTPNPEPVSTVMNAFASRHDGLAPIVIVADQVGSNGDPACADSVARGNAATYIESDVVNWATKHLRVIEDPRYWTLAGYSNGATCAVKFAAEKPNVFRNVLSISPEAYPGMHYTQTVIDSVYDGSTSAWSADKPETILAAHAGTYGGVDAVFTTGALDTAFGPATRSLAAAAQSAGMHVTLLTLPGVAHVGKNLTAGLTAGFAKLAPELGLTSACARCSTASR
ncbi:esterase [Planctomonas sp. JC2975]|uniref:alpha/beta hydrolase-fold protein n=1 Tax=Planctomonas sp. JC2975 TaxID=2729626 RepID=UPI00147471D9|nr:alpha/beta hydrolase-fold protein [Planctomonas sp. JC2975]NNC10625.1 esterase [Planctomonas sp. JC2975]